MRASRHVVLVGRLAQKALDDEHVAPLAIEAAVAAVHSDLAEAAAAQERPARVVLWEQAADQLPIAGALGFRGECFEQPPPDAAAARGGIDIKRRLANSAVALPWVVLADRGPADDRATLFGDDCRPPVAQLDSRCEVRRAKRHRLKRGLPLL